MWLKPKDGYVVHNFVLAFYSKIKNERPSNAALFSENIYITFKNARLD